MTFLPSQCTLRPPTDDHQSDTSGETTASDSGRGGSEEDIQLPPLPELTGGWDSQWWMGQSVVGGAVSGGWDSQWWVGQSVLGGVVSGGGAVSGGWSSQWWVV